MTAIQNLPPLLPQAQPATDAAGRSTTSWRNYIEQLDNRLRLLIKMLGTGSTTVGNLPSAATVGAAGTASYAPVASVSGAATITASGSASYAPVASVSGSAAITATATAQWDAVSSVSGAATMSASG